MSRPETLYERNLKRPLGDAQREAIAREAAERCRRLPFPVDASWNGSDSIFTISSSLATLTASFSDGKLVVSAELSLAARLVANAHTRQRAAEIIGSIADHLDL